MSIDQAESERLKALVKRLTQRSIIQGDALAYDTSIAIMSLMTQIDRLEKEVEALKGAKNESDTKSRP